MHEFTKETLDCYSQKAADFGASRRGLVWPELQDALDFVGVDGRCLDLGCGSGRMASLFSVDSYVGVDACEELLDVARCDNPNYFFKKGDVCDFEAEGEFDVVMFIAVLQHLAKDEDWLKALGNARKILKDSGKVIVSIWDFDGCEDGDMWLSFDHVGKRFYRAMPDEKFVELCESAGLNIVERKNGRNRIYILEN